MEDFKNVTGIFTPRNKKGKSKDSKAYVQPRSSTVSTDPQRIPDPPPTVGTVTYIAGESPIKTTSGNVPTISLDTVPVEKGGTGATSLTDHGIILGSGTSSVTVLGSATNGQIPIGSTGADPVLGTIGEGTGITVTNTAGGISIGAHVAATVSAPLLISGQAISLVNNAGSPATVTTIDIGTLDAASDIKVPTSKAVATAITATGVAGKKLYHGTQSIGAVSFDNTTHIVTIATGITYWYQGVEKIVTGASTFDIDSFETPLVANTLYYIYFNDVSGTLKGDKTFWNLRTQIPICTVFWNGSAGAIQQEWHNYTRDIDWHINAHLTIGARYYNGLDLTKPTIADDNHLQIESGIIYDEDLPITTGQQTTCRIFYKASASIYTYVDSSLPYAGSGVQPQYLKTGAPNAYTLQNVGASDFVVMWVYASTDYTRPIYIIPTHATAAHNTIALARAEAIPNLMSLNINPEMKLIYKFIYKGDGNFEESVDYRNASSLPAGGSASTTASATSLIPYAGITETTVQTGMQGLEDRKLALAGGTMTGDIAMSGTQQVTGLAAPDANGEAIRATTKITEALLESATDLKHAAVTVSAPIVLSGQAIELQNNAVSPAKVTAIDIGALANSDTVIPTSKAVTTALGAVSGGHTIIDENGDPMTARANLEFTGTGVTVTDATPNTVVTINAGTGGSAGEVSFSRSFIITNPTTASDSPVWRVPVETTITAVHLLVVGGTSLTGSLWEFDANGGSGSSINTSDMTGNAGTNLDDTTLSNPVVDALNYVGWKTTSLVGAVTRILVTFDFTQSGSAGVDVLACQVFS